MARRESFRFGGLVPVNALIATESIADEKPTPKERSTLCCGNDSKSEMRGLLAKSHLGAFERLLFALVEDGLVV